jgi:hypothetical protein
MGVVIPQVITPSRASGAQVIDGSLRFDSSKSQYLQRTFGSGNRQKYTWSGWVKKTKFGDWYGSLLMRTDELRISNGEKLSFNNSGVSNLESTGVLRDPGSFYHVVFKVDTTQDLGKIKGYINGVEFLNGSASLGESANTDLNDAAVHYIGNGTSSRYADYHLSQCYFIDGQALGPKFFGFNDPLTGTWRPRKLRAGDTSLISDGTTWSSFSSATLVSGSALANAFNGNVSIDSNSTATSVSGDNTWTFSPTVPLPVDNSLVVYVYPRSGTLTFKVNGVTITTNTGNSFNRVDLSEAFSNPTSLTSLVIESSGSGSYWMIAAIEIDGEILTDSAVTVDFGTNGFYLPLDGNSPIGQDKSGNGNDWTPVNFGGSVALDKATGALPILNTVSGGTQATVGVRTASEGFPGAEVNDGTVWSSDMDGSLSFSDVAHNAFDGDLSNTQTRAAGIVTFTFPKDVPFSSTVNLTASLDNGGGQIYVKDGTDSFVNVSDEDGGFPEGSSAETKNITSALTSPIKAIKLDGGGSGSAYARMTGIEVDGEVLVDGHGLVLALPLVGVSNDFSNQINSASSTKTVTVNSAAANSAFSNFYGGSYYFNGSSTLALSDLNGGTNIADFTFESWIYLSNTSSQVGFFSNQTSDNAANTMRIGTSGSSPYNQIWMKIGSSSLQPSATLVAEKWFHLAVTRSGSTVTIFIDGVSAGTMSTSEAISPSGFYLGVAYPTTTFRMNGYMQDVRFYKTAKYTKNFIPASTSPDILPDTPSGVSGSSKLTKITAGVGAVGFGTNGYMTTTSSDYNPGTGDFAIEGYFRFPDNSGTRRAFINDTGTFGSNSMVIRQYNTGFEFYCGGQSFSDSGYNMAQWNHAMITRSGTTIRYFVNGELRATDTSSNSISAEPTNQMTIGGFYDVSTPAEFMRGYASNLRLTVGSIPTDYQTSSTTAGTIVFTPSSEPLTSTSQGATSSDVKLLCCQSPTSATAAAVASASLSTNNTAEGTTFNPFTTDINIVRGQETGYCTLNPLHFSGQNSGTGAAVLSNGNLDVTVNTSAYKNNFGTIPFPSSGKYYFEVTVTSNNGSGNNQSAGIASIDDTTNKFIIDCFATSTTSKRKFVNGTATNLSGSFNLGDVIGVAVDCDSNTTLIKHNNLDIDSGYSMTSGVTFAPFFSGYNCGNSSFNFGQKPFKFPPPEGFQPLNAANTRPVNVISRPDQYVGVTTYTGSITDTSSQTVTGINFQSDLVWIKRRDGSNSHQLVDSVRGTGKWLESSGTAIENSTNTNGVVTDINSNGFTLTGGSTNANLCCEDGFDYVAWCWKAGGSKNTFNVDDVGYASASDVNMSAGSLMNTSQSWSSNASGGANVGRAFDGTGPRKDHYSHSASSLTVNFSPALSGRIIVYGGKGGGSADTFTLSDGSVLSSDIQYDADPYFSTLDFGVKTNISSIVCSAGYTLYGISVDGKMLVDSGGTNVPSTAATRCSVGTKQGFSIIKYTGPNDTNNHTVPHGLSQAPDFIMAKNLDTTYNWDIYHSSLAHDAYLTFTIAGTRATGFNGDPTSLVFFTEHDYSTNENEDYIAYCWHNVPGLQKFGKYTGNASATDGNFIELGFRPALIWIKGLYSYDGGNTQVTETGWAIYDSTRSPNNPNGDVLGINNTYVEENNGSDVDFLSNGFKLRNNRSWNTANGAIYCAWAEAPSFNLYGGGANAR